MAPEARAQPPSRVSKRDFGIAPDAFHPPVRNGPEGSGCAAPTGPGTGGTAAPAVANPIPFLLRGVSRSRNRPNRPNRPNVLQDAPGRLLLRLGVGRFARGVEVSAHRDRPTSRATSSPSRAGPTRELDRDDSQSQGCRAPSRDMIPPAPATIPLRLTITACPCACSATAGRLRSDQEQIQIDEAGVAT